MQQDKLRIVGRALGEFVLQWTAAGARPFGGDIELAMVFLAIRQANVAGLAPGGDEAQRRPISISAVANSLGLSRETTRRFVLKLESQGLATRGPEGIVIPLSAAEGQAMQTRRRELNAHTRDFVLLLRRCGVSFAQLGPLDLPHVDPHDTALAARDPPLYVERVMDRYMLRWAEASARDFENDMPLIRAYTGVIQANVRHILNDERLNAFYGDDEAPPDVLRRPVSVSALAASLEMPRETVRRLVTRLEALGHVVRTAEGVLTTHSAMWDEGYMRRLRELWNVVRHFVLVLRAGGVTFAD
ncbi:MAG: hypothetical protein JWR84_2932 [Caulobacter sp.]|nr:hypothetical protein [Caulobacter sp.]